MDDLRCDQFIKDNFNIAGDKEIMLKNLEQHDYYRVELGQWHRLENTGTKDLCIIEIQYGHKCNEDDIVRLLPI